MKSKDEYLEALSRISYDCYGHLMPEYYVIKELIDSKFDSFKEGRKSLKQKLSRELYKWIGMLDAVTDITIITVLSTVIEIMEDLEHDE